MNKEKTVDKACLSIAEAGKILAGPLEAEEGILYADIDLREIITSKRMFDIVGNYSRPDVFDIKVKTGK